MEQKSKKNNGGRPKKEPTVPVQTRYTKQEKMQLKERAQQLNFKTVSDYTRYCTLENPSLARTRRKLGVDEQELNLLRGELGKAGGNLNQLAKYQNIEKLGVDRASFLAAVASIQKAAEMIAQKLGEESPE